MTLTIKERLGILGAAKLDLRDGLTILDGEGEFRLAVCELDVYS